jgi:CheY-like chemotaxis protein
MREKGGKLTIELKEIYHHHGRSAANGLDPGKYQKLSVSDTGVGMSQTILQRIFEPYFTSKRVGEGTGMGLAVVHGIVKDHNGDINVDSTLGKGTTFHVFLPVMIQDKDQQDLRGDGQETGPFVFTGKTSEQTQFRILFVDDEQMLVEIGTQLLERLGHRVTALTNPVEALNSFQKNPDNFDLLMIDMNMPKMMGVELIKKCKIIRPGIPVILFTGFNEQINEENFKTYGIDAFVMKPIEMEKIAGIIKQVMEDQ